MNVAQSGNLCLADFAGYGACILQAQHRGLHKDANGSHFLQDNRKPSETSQGVPLMSEHEASEYRRAHDRDVRMLNRLSKKALREISAAELAESGIIRVAGGPVTKAEFITEILDRRWPITRLNETSHVLYHHSGERWSACDWCNRSDDDHA